MTKTPNPRICGRRICSGPCGRWRPLVDYPWRWPKNKNTYIIEGVCSTCKRLKETTRYNDDKVFRKRKLKVCKTYRDNNKDKIAEYKGSWEVRRRQSELKRRKYVPKTPRERAPGPPVPPIALRETDLELFKKMRRERHRWLMDNNPEYRQRRLEYSRIYNQAKRREAGSATSKNYTVADRKERVPTEPFRQWLLALWTKSEMKLDLEQKIGISDRQIRRIVDGSHNADDTVDLDLVDSCLVREGNTMLHDLYPDLYKRAA